MKDSPESVVRPSWPDLNTVAKVLKLSKEVEESAYIKTKIKKNDKRILKVIG